MSLFGEPGRDLDPRDGPDDGGPKIWGSNNTMNADGIPRFASTPEAKRQRTDQPTPAHGQHTSSPQPFTQTTATSKLPPTPVPEPCKTSDNTPGSEKLSSDDSESIDSALRTTNSTNGTTRSEWRSHSGHGDKKKRRFDSTEGPGGGAPKGPGGSDDGPSGEYGNDSNGREAAITFFRTEQKHLHIIAKFPGDIALLPDTWAGHLKDFPLPDGVFYKQRRKRSDFPRIYERTEDQDYAGSKIFHDIIKVQSRIRDIHDEYLEEKKDEDKDHIDKAYDRRLFCAKYVKALKPTLKRAIKWAWKDGGLKRFDGKPLRTIAVFQVHSLRSQEDAFEEIQYKMGNLAAEWRERLAPLQQLRREEEVQNRPELEQENIERLVPQAPVIYGFAIMEHNVLVVHQDASREDALPFAEMNLNMETDNQRQWYTMLIMVTICYARDRLMLLADEMHLDGSQETASSDPDA